MRVLLESFLLDDTPSGTRDVVASLPKLLLKTTD
jgi:hypothetical protein